MGESTAISIMIFGLFGFLGWTLRGLCEQTYFMRISEWLGFEELLEKAWEVKKNSLGMTIFFHVVLAVMLTIAIKFYLFQGMLLFEQVFWCIFVLPLIMWFTISVDTYLTFGMDRDVSMTETVYPVVRRRLPDFSGDYEKVKAMLDKVEGYESGVVKTLSLTMAKRILLNNKNSGFLDLRYVLFLTEKSARILSKFQGDIDLSNLQDLPAKIAYEFGSHNGNLKVPKEFVSILKKYKENFL